MVDFPRFPAVHRLQWDDNTITLQEEPYDIKPLELLLQFAAMKSGNGFLISNDGGRLHLHVITEETRMVKKVFSQDSLREEGYLHHLVRHALGELMWFRRKRVK